MKASDFLPFYWVGFLLSPILFFQTDHASIFGNGRWSWEDAPGFDTSVVKAGYVPIKYYVFGRNSISQNGYYTLEVIAYISILIFAVYFIGFCWNLVSKQDELSRRTAAQY